MRLTSLPKSTGWANDLIISIEGFVTGKDTLTELRKTASSLRRKYGSEHVEYANATLALGDYLNFQKKFEEAEQLYRQAAEIYERLGLGHELLLAIALRSLSQVLHVQGKSQESQPLWEQANKLIAHNS